jgi:hypothetical protein
MKRFSGLFEFPVERPEGKSRQEGRGKKMDVHVAQSSPRKIMDFDEYKHLLMIR